MNNEHDELIPVFLAKMLNMENIDSYAIIASNKTNSKMVTGTDILKAYGSLDFHRRELFCRMVERPKKQEEK